MRITVLIIHFTDFNIPDLLFDLVTYDCCHLKILQCRSRYITKSNEKENIAKRTQYMFLLLIIVVYNNLSTTTLNIKEP